MGVIEMGLPGLQEVEASWKSPIHGRSSKATEKNFVPLFPGVPGISAYWITMGRISMCVVLPQEGKAGHAFTISDPKSLFIVYSFPL